MGVKCECGGFAEDVKATPEEIAGPHNCGRKWACCVRASVCCLCKKRIVWSAPAPEME